MKTRPDLNDMCGFLQCLRGLNISCSNAYAQMKKPICFIVFLPFLRTWPLNFMNIYIRLLNFFVKSRPRIIKTDF